MRIFGIAASLAFCVGVGSLVFLFFNSFHDVEGASWIAILAGLMVTTFLGWVVSSIWEKI